jgi:hypothetical protein
VFPEFLAMRVIIIEFWRVAVSYHAKSMVELIQRHMRPNLPLTILNVLAVAAIRCEEESISNRHNLYEATSQ